MSLANGIFKDRVIRPWSTIFAIALFFFYPPKAKAQWDAPAGYYSSATGTGSTLKSQLTSIMTSGHIQRSYGDFRYSAQIHDRDPNNPSKILLAYNRSSVNGGWDSGSTWNREHVWPASRQPGSASNSSKANLGDPHALRPCNPSINSLRGNKPFGFETTFGNHGNVGSFYFPGDDEKGDIARQLFYSDTRWSSLGLSLTDAFPSGNQMGDLYSLVAWHYMDPPDEFERRRNHTIYSSAYNPAYYTNNRNAFVDRPEYVWSIYVNQQNDSMITIGGGQVNGDGATSLDLDFGPVILGTNVSTQQSITLLKDGIDGTYYSVVALDSAISSVNGFYNAFLSETADFRSVDVELQFNPNVPGSTSGTIIIDNLDVTTQGGAGRGANDGNDVVNLKITVLDHANASFSGQQDDDVLLVDLGDVALGAPDRQSSFSIYNLPSPFGSLLTAKIDLDGIIETDPANKFAVDGSVFSNLSGGQSEDFSVVGQVDQLGTFMAVFEFELSDENIPGAASQTISLMVSMDVVGILGDMNGDGLLDFGDIEAFVEALFDRAQYTINYPNLDPDVLGDFNNDNLLDFDDIEGFVDALFGS